MTTANVDAESRHRAFIIVVRSRYILKRWPGGHGTTART